MITPDFYIIGFMKCGTTSLHHLLNEHPKIEMAKSKEFHVFTRNGSIESYSTQYGNNRIELRGNTPQNYSKTHIYPDVPQKIHAALGERKLIFIVRNPKERLISHWREAIYHGLTLQHNWKDVSEEKRRQMIMTGQYSIHIKEYLKYFSPRNIYLLSVEELAEKPSETCNGIFDFLNLAPHTSSINSQPSNTKAQKQVLPSTMRQIMLLLGNRKLLGRIERIIRKTTLSKKLLGPVTLNYTSQFEEEMEREIEQQQIELVHLLKEGIRTSASLKKTILTWV